MRSVTTALLAHAAGNVKKRAASTEQIVAHIFLEAGAIVRKNMYVRDMNVDVGAEDGRQMEVSTQNLFGYGGVQFAVDITLRSVLSCDGEGRVHVANGDGVLLLNARTRKEPPTLSWARLDVANWLCWPRKQEEDGAKSLLRCSGSNPAPMHEKLSKWL